MGHQLRRINLTRFQDVKKHFSCIGIDQTSIERDVLDPKVIKIEANWLPMHSNVGNMTADRDNILADIEGSWIAHTFHRDIDTTAIGHFIDKGLDFINIT